MLDHIYKKSLCSESYLHPVLMSEAPVSSVHFLDLLLKGSYSV